MIRITPIVIICISLGLFNGCKSDCNEETNIEVLTNCYLQGEDERVYAFVMNVTPTCKQYELSYYLDNNEMNTIPVSNGMEVILGSRLPTIITYLSKESSGYERSISLLNDAFMDLECGGQPAPIQEESGLQVAENEFDEEEPSEPSNVQAVKAPARAPQQQAYVPPTPQTNSYQNQGANIGTNRENNTTTVEIYTPANIEIYSPNPVITRTIPAEDAPMNTEIIMEAENTTVEILNEEAQEEAALVIPNREKLTAVENVQSRKSGSNLGSSNNSSSPTKAPQVANVNKAEYSPEPTAPIKSTSSSIETNSRPIASAPKTSAPKRATPSIVSATPATTPKESVVSKPSATSSTKSTTTSKSGFKNLKEKGGIRSSNKCNGTDVQYMSGPYTMNIKAKKKLKLENFRVYADSQGTVDLIVNSLSMDEAEIMDDVFVLPSEAGTAINIYSLGITMNPGEEYAITVNPVTKGLRFESSATCTTDVVSSPLADIYYVDKKVVFFDLQFIY